MIGSNAARPTLPSGEWAPQSSAVRVTCAATTSAMNRPIQGGMIRNPTASIPMRPNSQPGQRQMLQPQVMNIGKGVPVLFAFHFYPFLEEERSKLHKFCWDMLLTCGLGHPPTSSCHKWDFAGTLYRIIELQVFRLPKRTHYLYDVLFSLNYLISTFAGSELHRNTINVTRMIFWRSISVMHQWFLTLHGHQDLKMQIPGPLP